jgi:hypothetical protein
VSKVLQVCTCALFTKGPCVALQLFITHMAAGAVWAISEFLHDFVERRQGRDEDDDLEDESAGSPTSAGLESRCCQCGGSAEAAGDDEDDFL